MKICVIGQGYIGLPTAILFAKNGCEVVGVDINENIIDSLNNQKIPIEEEGLQELFEVAKNNYRAQTKPEKSDVYIITVPTPYNNNNYSCDLTYVYSACNSIKEFLDKDNIIIIESTIAPLSMKNHIKNIFEKEGFTIGKDLFLAHCPERVLPGNLIYELIHNNRIIGGITPECAKKVSDIYKIFVEGNIIETSAEVAEMSKCMENTFRDVNIALANELVKISNTIGVNALEVISVANQHPRVNIHQPGPGVGGHCLAIDPYFIYALDKENSKIIKTSRDTNRNMPQYVVDNTKKILNKYTNDSNIIITVFGISYKGNSDDDRESPSYEIIKLLEKDYKINVYDPHIPEKSMNLKESLKDSSMILVLTDHEEFKILDYDLLSYNMKKTLLFDTKNIVNENDYSAIEIINFGNLYKKI